ncbi:eukaryotic membrane protein family-domain-containing protein [Cercophora newfieldiana]|uniref:Eukaryotic membrane protein family-domain-containing protein n=1 Tax=Cercophora newfieldiana TaxID=92897 RepID=A0AA39XUS8_9PEZI|nr:eukaryotic membrane protein family-domain-containing protein [Cercophora newfieldiana]
MADTSSAVARDAESALETTTHLPSPELTPTDRSPPKAPSKPQSAPERAVSSAVNGMPTPDASSESQSDDPSSDSASSGEPVVVVDVAKTRSRSNTKTSNPDGVRRLSASKIQELTASPESLPFATIPDRPGFDLPLSAGIAETSSRLSMAERLQPAHLGLSLIVDQPDVFRHGGQGTTSESTSPRTAYHSRPTISTRTLSTPPTTRRKSTSQPPSRGSSNRRNSFQPTPRPTPLNLDNQSNFPPAALKEPATVRKEEPDVRPPSPIPPSIPLPPMSIPTILQLELAGQRPSPLYIHHSYASDLPYESSAIKFERLKNFLLLPGYLERTIVFGALACLDAWLWTFTVLPMRFCIAVSVLGSWWAYLLGKEARWVVGFVWYGLGRMWKRGIRRGRRSAPGRNNDAYRSDASRSRSAVREPTGADGQTSRDTASGRLENLRQTGNGQTPASGKAGHKTTGSRRHRRTKSSPSSLTSFHKADLLQGAIMICSSIALMNLDASRMYHLIRGQSAIKLFSIYNLLEVGDRLLSALGQDIFECLFSTETLSRNSSGRSKVMLPLGMFLLALVYNILHSVTLFFQVISLNVAVNSYSNVLLTLLLSNQFVEIKSSVFKRFEKENTFQLACADIVERFQLWIMLLIIGMRNVVELGGWSVSDTAGADPVSSTPYHPASILPASFTVLPNWLWSGEVLAPFFMVIGSEMIVDWIKHAYVNKFNNIKPTFYARILDILCKDYYTNAFVTPSLTRRLGLPLLPLSCLFVRASVQIYHMFLATHIPTPLPPSSHTSLSIESATPSPAMLATLDRLDHLIRNALGRAVYGPYADGVAGEGDPSAPGNVTRLWLRWTSDDVIAALTMVVVFLLLFLVLLVMKLILGMVLLRYSRDRYARMKAAEHAVATGKAEKESYDSKGKRVGGYGQVEVGEERRRWIFADDPEGLRKTKEKEKRAEKGGGDKDKDLGRISRYEMVARRIW